MSVVASIRARAVALLAEYWLLGLALALAIAGFGVGFSA